MINDIQWKLSETGKCLCISSGQLFFSNKRPQGISYNEIMDMIRRNPNASVYHKSSKHILTLGKALQIGKLELLGKEVDLTTTIDLNTIEHERDFDSLPKTGKELVSNIYNSLPYKIDEI